MGHAYRNAMSVCCEWARGSADGGMSEPDAARMIRSCYARRSDAVVLAEASVSSIEPKGLRRVVEG